MTFPTIPTGNRVLSVLATSPAGTHTSPSLTTLTKNKGDLLIAIVILYDGNSTNAEFSAWGGSFTEFGDFAGTTTMAIGCAYKWSTGAETGTFTVTSADTSTNDSAFFLLSIPGAHTTTPPEAGVFVTGTAPNSGALDPAGWAAEDTLWIAVGGSGEDATTGSYTGIGTAPTNYGSQVDSGISADVVGGVEGSVAFRQLNASSEDPGAWSMDTSNARGASLLIAVRPAPTISSSLTANAVVRATQAGSFTADAVIKSTITMAPTHWRRGDISTPFVSPIRKVDYDGTYFVAVAYAFASNHLMAYATNPERTWTENTSVPTQGGKDLRWVKYGNSKWVAVGNDAGFANAQIWTATDPTGAWTKNATAFGNGRFENVDYGNGVWVASGYNTDNTPKLWTATDPTGTWTENTSASIDSLFSSIHTVYYANGYWLAAGANPSPITAGALAYATDPTGTWTAPSSINVSQTWAPADQSGGLWSIHYAGGYWVVGGYWDNANKIMVATDPTGTWTNYDTAFADDLSTDSNHKNGNPGIYSSDGHTWVIVGGWDAHHGQIQYGTPPNNWTKAHDDGGSIAMLADTTANPSRHLLRAFFANGYWIVVGDPNESNTGATIFSTREFIASAYIAGGFTANAVIKKTWGTADAPFFRAIGAEASSATASVNIPIPAAAQSGDMLVALVWWDGAQTVPAAPTNWTNTSNRDGTNVHQAFISRLHNGTDTQVTYTLGGAPTTSLRGVCVAFGPTNIGVSPTFSAGAVTFNSTDTNPLLTTISPSYSTYRLTKLIAAYVTRTDSTQTATNLDYAPLFKSDGPPEAQFYDLGLRNQSMNPIVAASWTLGASADWTAIARAYTINNALGFTADAWIAGHLVANAVIKKTVSGTFTADSVVAGGATVVPGSLTANAVVRATQAGSFTANAFIPGKFTANAVILKTISGQKPILVGTASNSASASTTVAVAMPATTQAGDLVQIRAYSKSGSAATYSSITGISGVSVTRTDTNPTSTLMGSQRAAFIAVAATSSQTATIHLNVAVDQLVLVSVWRGVSSSVGSQASGDRFNETSQEVVWSLGTAASMWSHDFAVEGNVALAVEGTKTGGSNLASFAEITIQASSSTLSGALLAGAMGPGSRRANLFWDGASRNFTDAGSSSPVIAAKAPLVSEAVVRRTQTGSFSADAVILRTQSGAFAADATITAGTSVISGSFTANADIRSTISGSATANAVIFRTQTGTLPADAVKKATISGTFTANAVVKRNQTGSLTANADIKATIAGSATANAVLFKIQAGSFTANALVVVTRSGSLTADADILRAQSGSFTSNSDVLRTQAGSFTANAFVPGALTANAVVRATQAGSFTANAFIHASFRADAVVRRNQAGSATADAYIAGVNTGIIGGYAVIKATISGSFTSNAAILKTQTGSFTANSTIVRTTAGSIAVDAVIFRNQTGSFTANADLTKTQAGTFTENAVIFRTQISSHTANAVLLRTQSGSFTCNAVIRATVSSSFTANADLKATISSSFSGNADIKATQAGSLTANAVRLATIAGSTAADAALLRTTAGSFSANADLRATRSGSFAADAVVRASISGTFSESSVLRRTSSGTFQADAVVLRAQTQNVSADAVIVRTQASSFTANAFVPGHLSADAVIRRTQTGALTSDAFIPGHVSANAVVLRTGTGSITANAFVAGVGTFAFSADAVSRRTISSSFTANAVILRTNSGSISANSVLNRQIAGIFTTDASLRAVATASITASAVKLKTVSQSLAADAVIRAGRTSDLSANAVLLSLRTGSAAASSVLQSTRSSSATANAVLRSTATGSIGADAYLSSIPAGTFTANAVLQKTLSSVFTGHSVKKQTLQGQLATDSDIRRVHQASVTAAAVLQRSTSTSFSCDAVIAVTQIGTSVAFALLRRITAGSFSADAAIRPVGYTITADAVVFGTRAGSFSTNARISKKHAGRVTGSITAPTYSAALASTSMVATLTVPGYVATLTTEDE